MALRTPDGSIDEEGLDGETVARAAMTTYVESALSAVRLNWIL